MLHKPVYLDNHATTRTDPRVLEAMLPYFTEHVWKCGKHVASIRLGGCSRPSTAPAIRSQAALGANAREIIFTSGATESNNLAIKGVAQAASRRGQHLVTAAVGTQGRSRPVQTTCSRGVGTSPSFRATQHGWISPESVARAITDQTVLVSVMAANNEVGTLNPIEEIGRLCHERGVVFHTDAAQAVGKVPLDVGSGDDRPIECFWA